MATSIGFTGDVMLGRGVDARQRTDGRSAVAVWGDVLDALRDLDGFVINLECCLSERGEMWTRTHRPFHFRASPRWATTALQAAGVDSCALANNHMLDFEVPALEDTLDSLDNAGIKRTGAGRTEDEALDPAVFTAGGHRIAVVSLTDNTPEFAADEYSHGTAYVRPNPDDDRTQRLVREALARARDADPDLLVASVHLGPNMVETPAEQHQIFVRWLVGEGVDVVHGHSSHVFQGIERHGDGLILHDTGDFVDDYVVDEGLRNDRSFLYELIVEDDEIVELRLHPVVITDRQVRYASDNTHWWLDTLRERSEPFDTADEFGWREGSIVLSLHD